MFHTILQLTFSHNYLRGCILLSTVNNFFAFTNNTCGKVQFIYIAPLFLSFRHTYYIPYKYSYSVHIANLLTCLICMAHNVNLIQSLTDLMAQIMCHYSNVTELQVFHISFIQKFHII